MALKALIFGVDDMFNELKPYYAREVQRGNLEIVGYALIENGRVIIVDPAGKPGGGNQFQLAIISSRNDFYRRMKFLEAQGILRNRIIDGRVFQVPNLDVLRFIEEGIAYGILETAKSFTDTSSTVYPLIYRFKDNNSMLFLGLKSYISYDTLIEGNGILSFGKFVGASWNNKFEFGLNNNHCYKKVSSFDLYWFDWRFPEEFLPPQDTCRINVGNDVWIGRGCILKCTNPNKPLVIGDGAVIASDSVVVKNVPPYAIVGGNPAKIIKYRFSEDVIESLLRIKWWDWSLDKIYDNFKYFNDVEKFISLHDKEV